MIQGLTYSKKCLLIGIGYFLFLFFAYKFSFSETIRNKIEIGQKKEKITWLKEKEKEIPVLKSKIEQVKKACSEDSVSMRDKLTAWISDYAENNHCTVTEIPVTLNYNNDALNVETNTFTIKGDFNSLLRLESGIENEFKFTAKIMSAHFFSIKDNQSKRRNLYMTIITQTFNETKNKIK